MKVRNIIAIGGSVVALAGIGAGTASAIPTHVTGTHMQGTTLYVDYEYYVPTSVEYRPSFKAAIWTTDEYPRAVRSAGRWSAGDNVRTGEAYTSGFRFPYIYSLKPGNYTACVKGTAQLFSGAASSHTSCRTFHLY